MSETLPFEQPALDDNMSRVVPVKNEELVRPFRAYAVVETEPHKRYGVVQVTIEKNKVTAIRIFGHLEIEKDFCRDTLLKTLNYEEKMGI